MRKSGRTILAVWLVLTVAGAASAADLTGAEIPFHVLVESWLSLLAAMEEGDRSGFLALSGLDPEHPAAAELVTLRDDLMATYMSMVRAEDPEAECWKASAMGRHLARIHLELAAGGGATAPWRNVLTLIDHHVRKSARLVSDRSHREAIEHHRELAICWAEGVRSVYPEEEVLP